MFRKFVGLSFHEGTSFSTPFREMAFAHLFVSGCEMSSVSNFCFCFKTHSRASFAFGLHSSSSLLSSSFCCLLLGLVCACLHPREWQSWQPRPHQTCSLPGTSHVTSPRQVFPLGLGTYLVLFFHTITFCCTVSDYDVVPRFLRV